MEFIIEVIITTMAKLYLSCNGLLSKKRAVKPRRKP